MPSDFPECPNCGTEVLFATYSSLTEAQLSCGCTVPAEVWERHKQQFDSATDTGDTTEDE